MHELLNLPDSNVVGVKIGETLSEDDYDTLVPHLRDRFEATITTRLLFELDGLEDWEPEEKWENLTFDIRYLQDVDKVAVVGDDPWETWMDTVEFLFAEAQVETFDSDDRDEALDWVRGEMEVPGVGPGSVSDPASTAQE